MDKLSKSLILAAVFSIATVSAFAQSFAFRVIGSKGKNTVNGLPLRVGSTINANSTIVVGNVSYLGLAHKSGKTLELKKPGTFSVSQLEGKLASNSSSLTNQYAKFIIDELTSGDGGSRQSRMGKTGSVNRTVQQSPIQVMLPEASEVIDGKITVKWYLSAQAAESKDAISSYKFTVKNMFGDVLLERVVSDNAVTIDLNSQELKNEDKALLYSVAAVGHEEEINSGDDDYSLKKLKPSELDAIKKELNMLPSEETALNKVILARYFEEKGLYANAIFAYEDAINNSELEQYQNLYVAFLDRNNLSKESRENN